MNNNDIVFLIIVGVIIIYLMYFKKGLYKKSIKYDVECLNCPAWNYRDLVPQCENACIKQLGKGHVFNKKWKRLNKDFNKYSCNCVKI